MGIHDVPNADANALVWSEYSNRITLHNFLKDGVVVFDSTNLPTNTDGEIHKHQSLNTLKIKYPITQTGNCGLFGWGKVQVVATLDLG